MLGLISLLLVDCVVGGLNVDEQEIIVKASPCFRLYNSTGFVGCSTPQAGTLAPIYGITTPALLKSFLDDNKKKKALLLAQEFFTQDHLTNLEKTGNVAGIMVLPGLADKPPAAFSPAPDLDKWNPKGSGWNVRPFSYPIALVDASNRVKLQSLAQKNRDAETSSTLLPQYMAKFSFFMGPSSAVDSTKCLEWKDIMGNPFPRCMPLGGQSSWGSTKAPTSIADVILVTSALDATSMFHDVVPGANEPTSSVVAILAAADALQNASKNVQIPSIHDLPSTVAFAIFQAETWGNIGSSSFVNDIQSFHCLKNKTSREGVACMNPIKPSLAFQHLSGRIKDVIAVDQVGNNVGQKFYVHRNSATSKNLQDTIVNGGSYSADGTGWTVAQGQTNKIPPTPLNSFVKGTPSVFTAAGISGVVFSGYQSSFETQNPYYHSHFDTSKHIQSKSIAAAATVLARAIYVRAGGTENDAKKIPVVPFGEGSLVDNLLKCITSDWNCAFMEKYISDHQNNLKHSLGRTGTLPAPAYQVPPSLYTSTVSGRLSYFYNQKLGQIITMPNAYEVFLRSFLARAVSPNLTSNGCSTTQASKNCRELGHQCITGDCVLSTAFYHQAISPAFIRSADGGSFTVNRSLAKIYDSTLWTEPYWSRDIGISVFPDGGTSIAWVSLVSGLFVFILGVLASNQVAQALQKQKLL